MSGTTNASQIPPDLTSEEQEDHNNNNNNDEDNEDENVPPPSANGTAPARRGGRRASRKNHRKNYRKNHRKNYRKSLRMSGGTLSQGAQFQELTRPYHGGRRMRGGAAPFPFTESTLLQGDLRGTAGVAGQDQLYREAQSSIPASMRYPQAGGGALAPASLSQADMLLPRGLSEHAMNPQWGSELRVNPEMSRMAQAEVDFRSTNTAPGFSGPINSYQTQAGGRRRSRKQRKASRKNRKNSRRN
jgi:hypothetical protein